MRAIRYLWALPNTLLGLAAVMFGLLFGARVRIVEGAIEAHGGAISFLLRRMVPLRGGAAALTLGHVILGASQVALDRARSHEHVHIRQYERLGPLFLPAYFFAGAFAAARGGRFYRDNPFERAAFERDLRPKSS